MEVSGIRKCFGTMGKDSVNLGIGQPDFETPEHIKEAAVAAVRSGFTGYTENMGMPDLCSAISEKLRRENRLDIAPENVMVTSGASEALFLSIWSLIDPGDEVLIADPGFLSYAALTQAARGRPVGVSLDEDLKLTPEAVAERMTSRTKAIVVNSPSNPTGAVQTEEEMRGLAEIAEDRDIALISDEVYEHFIYKGEHVSPGRFSDNVITINAVSKTYSMTGWRLGYVAAQAPALEHMLKAHQYVQACASSISQKAAYAALTGPQDCVGVMRDEFQRRRDILVKGFQEMEIDLVVPEGAFYLFPRVGDGDREAGRLLEHGVVVVPGSAFGPGGKEHIRISYAASEERIRTALSRMRDIL
ncbi:MAG: pyridoxal phosphate-dependent aminotransferase [Methanotrichaceae archaeon]|nr:pyridoxal phosphate-dependent aminotransferase [Methanotrichaceae archaeon]